MKSVTQIVVLIVVVVALIAGVTFVSQFDWLRSPKQNPPPRSAQEPLLTFPMKMAMGEFSFELGAPGHYDFMFQNRQTKPVDLYFKDSSCRCSWVEVGFVSAEDLKELEQTSGVTSVAQNLVSQGASLDLGPLSRQVWDQRVSWQTLVKGSNQAVVVAPAASASTPTTALLRLHWKGDKVGPHMLTAEMLAVREQESEMHRLEVPADFVPPINVFVLPKNMPPLMVRAGEFTQRGQKRTVDFFCYSSTRDRFPLSAKESRNDSRFVCVCTPLTDPECRRLEATIQARVRAGYHVTVTVHERHSENEPLDIGYFRRELVLTSDPELDPPRVTLTGMVRGEVTVGTADDKDRIDLGNFAAQSGQSKTIAICTEDPQLQLELAEKPPDYLEVKLQEVNQGGTSLKRQWNLQVTVPPNKAIGRLEESYIVLRTKSTPPRRVRIPIVGNAYQGTRQR